MATLKQHNEIYKYISKGHSISSGGITDCVGHTSKCTEVHKCQNNYCMFRLRDVYGHPVFCSPGFEEGMKLCKDALEAAGVTEEDIVGWPQWVGVPGTNCVAFYCTNYQPKEPL